MDVPDGFEVQAMSDEDYDDLIVEVLYNGDLCFLVSQEEGFDRLRVDIHPRRDGKAWSFLVRDAEAVLKKASSLLWDLRKIEG